MITCKVRMAKWLYNAIDSQSAHAGLSKSEAVDTLLRTGIRVYLLRDRHRKKAEELRKKGEWRSAILGMLSKDKLDEFLARANQQVAEADVEAEKAKACDDALMCKLRLAGPRYGSVMSVNSTYGSEGERDDDIRSNTSTADDLDTIQTSYRLDDDLVDALTWWATYRFHRSQHWTFVHLMLAAFAVEALRQKGDTSEAYHEALLEIQETVLEFVRKADGDLVFNISRRQ